MLDQLIWTQTNTFWVQHWYFKQCKNAFVMSTPQKKNRHCKYWANLQTENLHVLNTVSNCGDNLLKNNPSKEKTVDWIEY